MKTILCYGDSNTWGCIPGAFDTTTGLCQRYNWNQRWPGLLQKTLGQDFHIVEDAINGRATNCDEITPGRPYKNGLATLPVALEAHYPIDLVILMLGTNDTKRQFNRIASDIAEGMRELIQVVKNSNKGPKTAAPDILIIAPAHSIKIENMHPEFDDQAIETSKQLGQAYQRLAKEEDCEFLDAGKIVVSNKADGFHLDDAQGKLLAKAVANKVLQMFSVAV